MNILKIALILALIYLQGSMLLKQELSTWHLDKVQLFLISCVQAGGKAEEGGPGRLQPFVQPREGAILGLYA